MNNLDIFLSITLCTTVLILLIALYYEYNKLKANKYLLSASRLSHKKDVEK